MALQQHTGTGKKANTLPRPKIKFNPEVFSITLVDMHGRHLAYLFTWDQKSNTLVAESDAKLVLDENQHDSSWGKWDDSGRFLDYSEAEGALGR